MVKATWAKFLCGPINLYNRPLQDDDLKMLEWMKLRQQTSKEALSRCIDTFKSEQRLSIHLTKEIDIAEQRIKDRNFIYYTRTGRFPE